MRQTIRPFFFPLCALLLVACSASSRAPQAADEAPAAATFALRLNAETSATLRAEVIVSAADMQEIRSPLAITDGDIVGSIRDIPAGPGRLFTVNIYDATDNLLFTGSARLDLAPGQSIPVSLVLGEIETAAPLRQTTVELAAGVPMEMVWIEAGTFTMGSSLSEWGRNTDESPQCEVVLTQGFYLGKYEVTQRQWEAVTGERPWEGQEEARDEPDYPAVYISWHDVQLFIAQLNAAVGEDLYRLPTEAEWEYACRAGTQTAWSFGDDRGNLDHHVWFSENAQLLDRSHGQVPGAKAISPWGLYDMHGNVWEWVQDWLGDYPGETQSDPLGPANGTARVFRGGSFKDPSEFSRSAQRCWNAPDLSFSNIGVRLLRTR
jgi:formylglycine-generating enzyme required for sulfatase activity